MKRLPVFALAVDAAIVLAFTTLGQRSHDESDGVTAALGTAAPFLCGLVVAWIAVALVERRRGRDLDVLTSVDHGVVIALLTVGIGMVLRRFVWDEGTALAFVIVTAAFMTCLCGAWRAAWKRFGNRHANSRSSAS